MTHLIPWALLLFSVKLTLSRSENVPSGVINGTGHTIGFGEVDVRVLHMCKVLAYQIKHKDGHSISCTH
jgi:hypothetical protein